MPNRGVSTHSVDMMQTIANRQAEKLVCKLHDALERTETASRKNMWDTEHQRSMYPGGVLVNVLSDLRGVLRERSNTAAVVPVAEILLGCGRQPSACTTVAVRQLCEHPSNLPTKGGLS